MSNSLIIPVFPNSHQAWWCNYSPIVGIPKSTSHRWNPYVLWVNRYFSWWFLGEFVLSPLTKSQCLPIFHGTNIVPLLVCTTSDWRSLIRIFGLLGSRPPWRPPGGLLLAEMEFSQETWGVSHRKQQWYHGWKKSCTILDGWNPTNSYK